jgi:hypothetical protein
VSEAGSAWHFACFYLVIFLIILSFERNSYIFRFSAARFDLVENEKKNKWGFLVTTWYFLKSKHPRCYRVLASLQQGQSFS